MSDSNDDGFLHNGFLRRFLLLKKLKSSKPAARPLGGRKWSECYTVGTHGRLMLWYNIWIDGGKISTGAITG
jgi:hypothetical protein